MYNKLVKDIINKLVDTEKTTIQLYEKLPYGRQVTDRSGDYMIFFYHPATDQIMYCFKDTENDWYRLDPL